MKIIRIVFLIMIIFIISIFSPGCWNYREIDKLGIVAGVAVDKGKDGKYIITVETAEVKGDKDTRTISKTYTMQGDTMFDAVRNEITMIGKRLYWSHTKVIILSKEIASEGVIKVLDWYNRDSETRQDVHILISKVTPAKDILEVSGDEEDIKSFILDDMLTNQASLSKAPSIDILQFDNDLEADGVSPIAPVVDLIQTDNKKMPHLIGTAIFRKDRLAGFLNSEETKDLIFIRNKIKGGLLIEGIGENNMTAPVSLEIFHSKTTVKPVVEGKNISFNLNIETITAIDEIEGTQNLISESGRNKLEESAQKKLKIGIKDLISKLQSEYDLDVFGFGAKLKGDNPYVWKQVSNNWGNLFSDLKVNVVTKVHIRNSATLSKPLKEGD